MSGDDELRAHLHDSFYIPYIEPVLLFVARRLTRWLI